MSSGDDIWGQLVTEALDVGAGEADESADDGRQVPLDDDLLHKRFLAFKQYNATRIDRLRQGLEEDKRRLFELFPLLLHQPIAGAPGGGQPHLGGFGIVNFEANERMKDALELYFPRAPWMPGALLGRPVIQSVLLIGSMGTVAQTSRSDLDVWVVCDESIVGTAQHERLLQRLGEIEAWINDRGLEVHFFPLTADQVRRAEFGSVGPESAGSALRQMLREEFFRTHVLLQGKVPLWWLADPSSNDDRYAEVSWMLRNARRLSHEDFIDLGNSRRIPPGEFLGACLWQIVKSLRRPFKSLLKLTLLERAMRWPEAPLLCEQLKARVHAKAGGAPLDADPYFIMVDTVVSEFERGGMPDTAELLRECFYLQLSSSRASRSAEIQRRRLLSMFAEKWGWSAAQQAWLDEYLKWPLSEIVKTGNRIQEYMDTILDGLRQQLGAAAAAYLDERDLALLERKMKTSRSVHPDQVPLLPVAYYPASVEQVQLVIHHDDEGWWLSVSKKSPPVAGPFSRPEIAAQCAVVNGLFGAGTALEAEGLPTSVLRRRMERMARFFSGARPEAVPIENFGRPARQQVMLLECEGRKRPESEVPGTSRLSDKWDLLEYDDGRISLLEGVTSWSLTTWGTVVHRRWPGEKLPELLLEVARSMAEVGKAGFHCSSADTLPESQALSARLQRMLDRLGDAVERTVAEPRSKWAFLLAQGGFDWAIACNGGQFELVGPMDRRAVESFLLQGGRKLIVEAGSMRWQKLAWALERYRPGAEEVFLFDATPATAVVFGSDGAILVLEGRMDELVARLGRAGGARAIRACYQQAETGRFSECSFPTPRIEDTDVVAELLGPAETRLWVDGFSQPARDADQAATWLLSTWRPGEEREPTVRLRPAGDSWPVGLPGRLVIYSKLLEKLGDKCRMDIPVARKHRSAKGAGPGAD